MKKPIPVRTIRSIVPLTGTDKKYYPDLPKESRNSDSKNGEAYRGGVRNTESVPAVRDING